MSEVMFREVVQLIMVVAFLYFLYRMFASIK